MNIDSEGRLDRKKRMGNLPLQSRVQELDENIDIKRHLRKRKRAWNQWAIICTKERKSVGGTENMLQLTLSKSVLGHFPFIVSSKSSQARLRFTTATRLHTDLQSTTAFQRVG